MTDLSPLSLELQQTLERVDAHAKAYWAMRQQQAARPPTFSLHHDHHSPVLVPSTEQHTAQQSWCIPVRLDLEADGYKLREAFLWNPHDFSVTAQYLAEALCSDFDLPQPLFSPLILQSLQEQQQDYEAFLEVLKQTAAVSDVIQYWSVFRGIRGVVKLDIVIGTLQLLDQLEWDLAAEPSSAAEYAGALAKELSLPSEFVPAIEVSITEQCYYLQKALVAAGWSVQDNGCILLLSSTDPELPSRILPRPGRIQDPSAKRDVSEQDAYTPQVMELGPADIERLEVVRERDSRRWKRKQTRGSRKGDAWALASPPKLHPTPLTYKGSVNRVRSIAAILDEEDDIDIDDRPNTLLMHHGSSSLAASASSEHVGAEPKVRGRGRGRARGRGRRPRSAQ